MNNIDELVKQANELVEKGEYSGYDVLNVIACLNACADAIEALQAHRNQARLDCAIAERNHMNTVERFLEAQERIDELQSELKPFQDAAAEYGVDAKTMLTLAKSQIATAQENISLRAERDALLKAVTKPSVQERGD